MKKLYIVGAGGFGRELKSWISQHPHFLKNVVFTAFLDDNKNALDSFSNFAPVHSLGDHTVSPENIYLCGIAVPSLKEKLIPALIKKGAQFESFIHPSSIIGERVQLGRGSIICPQCVLSCDIKLGDFTTLNIATTIGHDVQVGDWTTASAQVDLTGGVKVGQGVFFGSRATVIPHKTIGDYSTIAAGAVVFTSVPPKTTFAGNPAREI
ncbi:MAG: NeuD/PglB/VioB family sugar acetyltransferase [Opitutae bacterium]|jgi:sugar O-acyltransferase (sialic acid O-acetyltransferase NeuD family)